MGLQYRVLGPVRVITGGQVLPVTGGRLRTLLAGLLLRANQPVPVEQLAHWLWGDHQPRARRNAVQAYVLRLRRFLGADTIRTVPGGYQLSVAEGALDAARFHRLVEQARTEQSAGRPDAALRLLDEARRLWH